MLQDLTYPDVFDNDEKNKADVREAPDGGDNVLEEKVATDEFVVHDL